MKLKILFLYSFAFFTSIFVIKAQTNDNSGVFSNNYKKQKAKITSGKDSPLYTFPAPGSNNCGLDYQEGEGLWIAQEQSNIYLVDVTNGSILQTINLAGIAISPDGKQNGVDVLPDGNLLLVDFNGDGANTIDDYIFEIDPETQTLVNYWPLDGTWNTSTDGTYIDDVFDVTFGHNGNYFVTSSNNNIIYEIQLQPGNPGTWNTVATHSAPTVSATTGIDFVSGNYVISDYSSTNIIFTDETFTQTGSISAEHSSNSYNNGVCWIQGNNPYNIAVIDFYTEEVAVFETAIIPPNTYTVTFNVDDGEEPVQGAKINIDWQNIITNYNGVATIELEDGTYSYTITREFCDNYYGDITVAGSPQTVDVSMNCTDVYSVTFCVTNETNPIPGAIVAVPDLNFEEYTNIDGITVITDVEVGTYSYTVSATGYTPANGDFEVIDQDITVDVTLITGLANYNSDIAIYPNPNTGEFNINVDKEYNLQIMDITGKVIYSEVLKHKENNINLSSQQAGIYIIKLTSGEKTYNYKVLVK